MTCQLAHPSSDINLRPCTQVHRIQALPGYLVLSFLFICFNQQSEYKVFYKLMGWLGV